MAQLAGLKWDELDLTVRRAVTWALSAQGDHVSSRGLLVGLLLADPGGPPDTLLAHFDVRRPALIDALATWVPERPIDVTLPPAQGLLDEPPSFSANASEILARAADLRSETSAEQVDGACVFGALLQTPDCAARRALAGVLGEEVLDRVSRRYLDWLLDPDGGAYAVALARDFPREPASPRKATKQAPARSDPPRPWPFLAVVRRRAASADGPARVLATGLGFVGRDGTLVTVAGSAAAADAPAHLPGDDSEHEFRVRVADAALASLELTPPPSGTGPGLAPARRGQACSVATIDGESLDITTLTGVVAAGTGDDPEDFRVQLDDPLSEGRTAAGSPVVGAGGEIVGIVAPTGTNRSVDAYGIAAIARVLPAAEPAPPATGTLAGAGNDSVGNVDQLGFTAYVQAFADLIASPHTQPPLTIGIFGSWGMGKSFLLEHIEREIDARQPPEADVVPRVHVVRFNAWEYSATEVVWPGLARKIVTHLDRLDTWPWYRRLGTRVRWNVARQWRELRTQLIAGALVVGTAIAIALQRGEDGIATAIVSVTTGLGVLGLLKAAKDPVANWLTALFCDSDYGRQLGVMEDIKHDLESLEARLHRTDADGNDVVTGRILVLIDDLDRCEPAKAVEVLQAVNLLLNFRSFVVCLGIDARIITGAVEKHYEGLLGRAGASGYEYLDKIVQIPFRIPEPGRADVLTFIAGQLGDPARPEPERAPDAPPAGATPAGGDAEPAAATTTETPDDAAPDPPADPSGDDPPDSAAGWFDRDRIAAARRRLAEIQRLLPPPEDVAFTYAELEAFERFADHLRPNPRHLKRLVNVYRLVRSLAITRDERLVAQRPAATIRWLVMWSQWPYASLAMLDRYDALVDEHGDALAERVAVEDPLLHLLDAARPGLDAAWCARLDDDHDDLRKLLSIPGCGLSWDEIRRIRRFTVNFNPAVEEQVRQPRAPVPTGSDTA